MFRKSILAGLVLTAATLGSAHAVEKTQEIGHKLCYPPTPSIDVTQSEAEDGRQILTVFCNNKAGTKKGKPSVFLCRGKMSWPTTAYEDKTEMTVYCTTDR